MATDKKRGTEVISDMLRSLAVVGIVIVPLWLLIPHHAKQTVTRIDYSTALSQARRLSTHPVLAPAALPPGWAATSVSLAGGNGKPIVFHIGFVTPAGDYAAVEESDGPQPGYLVTLLGNAPKGLGDVRVGALAWRSLRGADGRVALVRPSTPPTVVVTGTAALPELVTLALSLR